MEILIVFSILVIFAKSVIANGQINKEFIKYNLYTPDNPGIPLFLDRLKFDQISLSKTEETKFIIHGFTEDSNADWMIAIKNNYLSIGVKNVILVDWGTYSHKSYFFIKDNYEGLATVLAEDLFALASNQGIGLDMFHLAVFSISSHIAGVAGHLLWKSTGQQLGRITALDPAGPFFIGEPPQRRLTKKDAKFVDIIHTFVVTGYFSQSGDADFWPNGGFIQPGCLLLSPCAHMRAALLFAESITSKDFTARSCLSYPAYNSGVCNLNTQVVMGEHVDRTMKGNFYLYTNAKPPYACRC